MYPPATAALSAYVYRGNKSVPGWFARTDAEIFRSLLFGQFNKELKGSMVEIGVHHGRSFIAMCLGLRPDEKALCIDIFDDQHLNKDFSGKGNRAAFDANLRRFRIPSESVVVEAKSSTLVTSESVLQSVGSARFFSIDGGHWLEVVHNDLCLAELSIAEHGIIVLDDFHRPEWPDVSAGYFAWYARRQKPIVPFAIGFNKLYLCHENWFRIYQNLLIADVRLSQYLAKSAIFQTYNLPVYQKSFLPELRPREQLIEYLKTFQPDFYNMLMENSFLLPVRRILKV